MNYLLPLYIDYLERPEVYEYLYLKHNDLLVEYGTTNTLSDYAKKLAARDVKAAAKRTAAKQAAKQAAKTTGPKLQAAHGTEKGMKAVASHKPTPPSPKGSITKVAKPPAAKSAISKPLTKAQLDIQRRTNDLKALQKKKDSMDPKVQASKQKVAAKKVLAKKGSTLTHAQKVHAQKTAAKGSEFGQNVVNPLKKVTGKKSPGILKTLGKAAPKAGQVAAAAAAAYGGYKLYKRHFSKAAQKCKGKAGAERTLCLQQNTGRG